MTDSAPTDCPKCGCNATDVVERVTRWGTDQEQRVCDYCGHRFTTQPTAAELQPDKPAKTVVVFRPLRCPYCNSKAVKVTGVPGDGVRWHKCRSCCQSFQSVEE